MLSRLLSNTILPLPSGDSAGNVSLNTFSVSRNRFEKSAFMPPGGIR